MVHLHHPRLKTPDRACPLSLLPPCCLPEGLRSLSTAEAPSRQEQRKANSVPPWLVGSGLPQPSSSPPFPSHKPRWVPEDSEGQGARWRVGAALMGPERGLMGHTVCPEVEQESSWGLQGPRDSGGSKGPGMVTHGSRSLMEPAGVAAGPPANSAPQGPSHTGPQVRFPLASGPRAKTTKE